MDNKKRHAVFETRAKKKIGGVWQPVCDLCQKNAASEIHHVYKRSLTTNHEAARKLSEHTYVLSALCPQCHATADEAPNRDEIFKFLYRKWGKSNIETIHLHMSKMVQVFWDLPEEE